MNAPVFAPWDDPDAKPLIQFQGVTKRFGAFTAIEDLTLDIYPREFFALLGPSGCGKTTMMRMLAGFETPTSGTILLDGQKMGNRPPNKRPVNMMFQSYALFPHLSVWENIAFGLRREGMKQAQMDARVDEMLRLTRLEKFAQRKPHQISGGQKQRVALARSLAKSPKLLLLDEPLGALDKKLREETQFELMDIQESTGTTFVIVTHDQEEAMTVASRVAVMDEGRIVQVATPTGIYETPNSLYVADFIGDINIIEGGVESQTGDVVDMRWKDSQPPLVGSTEKRFQKGDKCIYAVRPEKIGVHAKRPDKGGNIVKGKILDIAYLGNVSTYHAEIMPGVVVKAQSVNVERSQRRSFTWEDEVWLSWDDDAAIVFEA